MRTAELKSLALKNGLVGGPFGSSLVNADYAASGIPVIRGTNLNYGRYVGGDHVFVSEQKFERDLARNSAKPGDLVFTQRGTIGQVALVSEGLHAEFVISQSQMRLRVDPSLAHAEYLYYACSSQVFTRQVFDRAIATGVPHINLGILAKLTVPLPDLSMQQAIAEVLGALDDKIAANTKLADTIDSFAAGLLLSQLTGESESLDELATITMGSSPKGEDLNESGDGIPFYQGVRDFGFRSPTRRVFTAAPVRLASAGDVLVSVRAPVGDVNVANEMACIGRGVAAVRSRHNTQSTLFHQLRAEREAWAPFEAEGTVFGSINRNQLHSIRLRVVHSEDAITIETELSELEASIASLLIENRSLATIRDTLLPQLMSGKLRVRDAERTVSEVL